jgi:hypothetical protein
MKYLFSIILFFLISFGTLKGNVKDTTKLKTEIKLDIKKEIINKLFHCFTDKEFFSAVIFCNGQMDFIIKRDSDFVVDSGTDYKALSNLTNFFQPIEYSRFKILSGKNKLDEDVIFVQIYLLEHTDEYKIDVFFVLNCQSEIKTIYVL